MTGAKTMARVSQAASSCSRTVMMAAVLGTALVAGGGSASATVTEVSPEAIAGISRYCQACWRNARLPSDRWTDCTQEVFARLLERLKPQQWARILQDDQGEERREFLRAIDAVKKRTQRARKFAPLTQEISISNQRSEKTLHDEREAFAQAAEALSSRQRTILQLTIEGWNVSDIADELGIPVERVSDEKYKAIRKLRHQLGV